MKNNAKNRTTLIFNFKIFPIYKNILESKITELEDYVIEIAVEIENLQKNQEKIIKVLNKFLLLHYSTFGMKKYFFNSTEWFKIMRHF